MCYRAKKSSIAVSLPAMKFSKSPTKAAPKINIAIIQMISSYEAVAMIVRRDLSEKMKPRDVLGEMAKFQIPNLGSH